MKKLSSVVFTLSLLISAYSYGADAVKVTPNQQKVISSENGRFVFGQISDFRSDQYMLDTKTGRLWMIVLKKSKNSDGTDAPGEGFRVLDPIFYNDINGNLNLEPK
ncbi:hypothetical protein [Methylophilus sp. DW102]|uniref:hypothetical protein n=1 Tax=Methylophilus sp. DW102 TaxID=3095607 RepID=UPI00308982CD|nr:hypothetical protein MTDW_10880 [Methylophilus sp. DW102]